MREEIARAPLRTADACYLRAMVIVELGGGDGGEVSSSLVGGFIDGGAVALAVGAAEGPEEEDGAADGDADGEWVANAQASSNPPSEV